MIISDMQAVRAAPGISHSSSLPWLQYLYFNPSSSHALVFAPIETWGLLIQAARRVFIILAAHWLLHIWSRAHLRHYYAERVEVQPEHKVIDTGPYQLMRHPVITSFFGIAIGLFLINPALTTLAALLYTIWDFTAPQNRRKTCSQKLCRAMRIMRDRTPRFLPRVWRSR